MPDDLSLLLQIKGENVQAKNVIADTRTAISGLRTHYGSELGAMNAVTKSVFGELTQHLNVFVGEKVPLLGGAFVRVGENLKDLSSEAESTGGALAGMAGPIGIAVAALAAMTAVAFELSKQFIDLTVSTAEWEGKMEDLSQQVGLSTETLSALEVLAKTTGGSIEQITASLGIFQKKLEEGQEPGSKAAETLKRLGIDTTDTEKAFREAITALGKMKEGSEQTALALDLFGRGGKSVLAIVKETNGNLDEAIEKFRRLGLVVSKEDAKAADEFNDQLALIGFQIRATTALFVKDSIPQILSSLKEISTLLKDNRKIIQDLGEIVKANVNAAVFLLHIYLDNVNAVRNAWLAVRDAARNALGIRPGAAADVEANLTGVFGKRPAGADVDANLGANVFQIEKRKEAVEKISAGQRLLNQLIDDYNKLVAKEVDLGKLWLVNEELKKKEYDDIDPKLRRQVAAQAILIDIEEQTIKEKKKAADADKAQIDAEKKYEEERKRLYQDRLDLESRIVEAVQSQREVLSQLQGFEKSHIQIVEEYILTAVKQAEAIGGVTEKMKEYFKLLIQIAAKEDEIEAKNKALEAARQAGEDTAEAGTKLGRKLKNPPPSAIDQLFKAVHDNLSGTKQSAALAGLEALTEGFQGLGQAVGQVVQAWVLYGNSGTSVRKMTAEILAGVASQAAIKAVFELAEGFAALALAFFGVPNAGPSASAHFTAAAIYGGIAGVAAIAGRGIAGNEFTKQGSSTSGGSTGGGSSTSSTSSGPSSITLGSQRPAVIHMVIEHKPGPLFDSHVESVTVRSAGNGGAIRQAIVKEIRRQE